jgi:hypothetical protein
LKKRELARLGSKRTAHLRHTGMGGASSVMDDENHHRDHDDDQVFFRSDDIDGRGVKMLMCTA